MFTKDTINAITTVAKNTGYEPAALLAVADVESAGVPFWKVGGKQKPAVRFEGHYFYKLLSGAQRDQAVAEGLANPKAGAVANPTNYSARYDLIERAAKINRNVAYQSISWGMGQVMGANYKDLGYEAVEDLVAACDTVEGQAELIVNFINNNGLKDEVDENDWAGFAKIYNGSNFRKNQYDKKLAAAYLKYSSGEVDQTADIAQLQMMLNKINSYGLIEDGNFGDKTKTALRDFQLKNGLLVDGKYGPISREAVSKAYLAIVNKSQQNTGIGTSAVATVGTAISTATQAIEPLAKVSQIAQYVFLGLLVIGVLFTLKTVIFAKKDV